MSGFFVHIENHKLSLWKKRAVEMCIRDRYTMGNELPLGDQVFILQSRIIKQLAEEGPCVILGRCGDYVLRELSLIHISVLAIGGKLLLQGGDGGFGQVVGADHRHVVIRVGGQEILPDKAVRHGTWILNKNL